MFYAFLQSSVDKILFSAATSSDDMATDLSELLCEQLQSVASFHLVSDMHISLSKTFVMRHHWIEPVVADLRRKLALCHS